MAKRYINRKIEKILKIVVRQFPALLVNLSQERLFCYAKLMEPLVLLRRNILRQNNFSEATLEFPLLLRRRIVLDKKIISISFVDFIHQL